MNNVAIGIEYLVSFYQMMDVYKCSYAILYDLATLFEFLHFFDLIHFLIFCVSLI